MEENKAKYAVMNDDSVIAIIYESKEYGRTMVVLDKINLNFPISIYNLEKNEIYGEPNFLSFIWEMLPKKEERC